MIPTPDVAADGDAPNLDASGAPAPGPEGHLSYADRTSAEKSSAPPAHVASVESPCTNLAPTGMIHANQRQIFVRTSRSAKGWKRRVAVDRYRAVEGLVVI